MQTRPACYSKCLCMHIIRIRQQEWPALKCMCVCMPPDCSVQRLHPNHVQPRNIYSQYNSGWIMFFQPARTQGMMPSGGVSPQSPDAAFAALLATASRPLEQLQQQQQVRMAAVAANPWVHGAPSASMQLGPAPPHAGHTGSSGYWSQPALQQPYMHAGLQMQPQAAPPSASYQQQPQYGANDAGISAQPGESDEAFAQRLAAMYGSSPAGSMGGTPATTAPPSAAGTPAPSRLASATTQGRPPAQVAQQDSSNPFAQQTHLPQASDNPFRAHSAGTPSQQQQQQPGQLAVVSGAGAPSAPSDPYPAPAAAPALAATPPPASAAAAAAVSVAAEGADVEGSDADLCVICLSAPREVGLLHGTSVHKCLCKDCAPMVRVGTACPMCRQTVERVLGVF